MNEYRVEQFLSRLKNMLISIMYAQIDIQNVGTVSNASLVVEQISGSDLTFALEYHSKISPLCPTF